MRTVYNSFWSKFIKYCEQNNSVFSRIAIPSGAYMSKTINKVRVDLCAYKSTKRCKFPIRVEVYFTGRRKDDHNKDFEFFFQHKSEIEKDLGFSLVWPKENLNVKSRKIYYSAHQLKFGEDDDSIFEFFNTYGSKILQVFGQYREMYF